MLNSLFISITVLDSLSVHFQNCICDSVFVIISVFGNSISVFSGSVL